MNDRRSKNQAVVNKVAHFIKVDSRQKPLRRNEMLKECDNGSGTLKVVDKKTTEVITSEFQITKLGILNFFGIDTEGTVNKVYLKTREGEIELDCETFVEGIIKTTVET
jgi:hypothetical protein